MFKGGRRVVDMWRKLRGVQIDGEGASGAGGGRAGVREQQGRLMQV